MRLLDDSHVVLRALAPLEGLTVAGRPMRPSETDQEPVGPSWVFSSYEWGPASLNWASAAATHAAMESSIERVTREWFGASALAFFKFFENERREAADALARGMVRGVFYAEVKSGPNDIASDAPTVSLPGVVVRTGKSVLNRLAEAMSKLGEGVSSKAEGPTFWDHYKANFEYRWVTTNRFFFLGPTRLARTAVGLVTTGAVARTFGTVSPLRAVISIFRPGLGPAGIATLGGVGGTLASAGVHIVFNAFLAGLALEAGITLGAAGGALADTMIWSRQVSP